MACAQQHLNAASQCQLERRARVLTHLPNRPRGRARIRPLRASNSSPGLSNEGQDNLKLEKLIFTEGGHALSLTSRQREELWPELHRTREEAVQAQLAALQANNVPYTDHGVEVMYRFANFDPFNPRTTYFGRIFDLGQFERFRRIMHTPPYAVLLNHSAAEMLSSLEVSEHMWVARVEVTGMVRGGKPGDVAVYEFTMVQRLGGVHDGYWFTQSLVADGNEWEFMRGSRPWQAV